MTERLSGRSIDTNKIKRPITLTGYETRFRQRLREVRRTRKIKKEDEGFKEKSPAEIREELMSRFQDNINVLGPKLAENRAREASQRQRPLITAIVSLWEEDEKMLASKMFTESLSNLRQQATISNMDLDFIIVANNGGGKNEKLGNSMTDNMSKKLQTVFGEDAYREVHTERRDLLNNPSTPWSTKILLAEKREEGNDRCFFVIQPHDKLNAGKIRALRDVTHSITDEIKNGYVPDAIFQMDAESILSYKPTHHKLHKQPFRALYDALKRRQGVVAIGSKNKFDSINPETGKPLEVLMPFSYESLTKIDTGTRENFISFYGGSILSEPDYYLAGMNAITEVTYGSVGEDYLFTQLLREYAKTQNTDEKIKLNSLKIITHLNRYPDGKKNMNRQLLRWKRQANAIDQIFPDSKYNYKSDSEYLIFGVKNRIKTLKSLRRPQYLRQLGKDISSIPGIVRVSQTKKPDDPFNGESTWEHFRSQSHKKKRS